MAGADPLTQGAGGLNGDGAVRLAASIDTRTPVGQPWVLGSVVSMSTIDDEALLWGHTLIWGDSLVWGESLVWKDPPPTQP